ncbi:MAG: glycosyltransferase family 4 protein [Gammaproteobacteria bacterium]|nr:glycosyltransferase family 4 protein [Gammaproteobacteria bacterium]
MNILALTNLFPSAWDPLRASYNRQQFDRLAEHHDVEVLVAIDFHSRMRRRAAPPPTLQHARTSDFTFWYPPKVGRSLHGLAWYASLLAQHGRRLGRQGFDLLLASWGYPDAVGTRWLARRLGLPYVVKVHGSDLNALAPSGLRRRQVCAALRDAGAVISVSSALGAKAVGLGVPAERVHVIYNGVDATLFRPGDRAAARNALGLPESGRIVLYAGNLKPEKGCFDLLDAFASAPGLHDCRLAFVGDGPARAALARRSSGLDAGGKVTLAGARPHAELATWMQAADLLCLPSHNEGVPNVVLEAMSCGLPVVATRVGGIPEVLPEFAGKMVPPRDVPALAGAIAEAVSRDWPTAAITKHAGRFTWSGNISKLDGVLRASVGR